MTLTETVARAIDSALREHMAKHGPSGGAWNISSVLECLSRAPDAALTALAAAGPSEKMVEAGARALCAEHGYNPDNIIHVQGHTPLKEWMGWRSHARACLTAALAAGRETT